MLMHNRLDNSGEYFAVGMKLLREAANLTQVALATLSGLSFTTINQVEGGRRTPDLATLQKIAAALESRVDIVIFEGRMYTMSNPEAVRMKIARELTKLRVKRGLSKNALAKLASTSPTYISQIEGASTSVTVEKLSVICAALDVSLADFFTDFQ